MDLEVGAPVLWAVAPSAPVAPSAFPVAVGYEHVHEYDGSDLPLAIASSAPPMASDVYVGYG